MMEIIITILYTVMLVLIASIIVSIWVLGWPISRRKSYNIIESLYKYELNTTVSSNDLLYSPNKPYIACTPFLVPLFKYYVEDKGLVWRGSFLHRAIEARFKELKNKPSVPSNGKQTNTKEFNSIFRRF